MTPYKYTVKNEEVTFHYTFTQLRAFITEGQINGVTDWAVFKRSNNFFSYRSYCNFKKRSFHIKWLEWINGPTPSNDQILTPPKPIVFTKNYIILPKSNKNTQLFKRNKPNV